MKLPTARQLQYFLAVADALSFSRAAEICHITQSTLSNGLSELESTLGKRLFNRDTRTVTLTPAGYELINPARSILEQLKNLVHLTQRHRAPLSSHLILGIIPTIAPYLLPYILPRQQTEFPELDLQLKEDLTVRLLENLQKGTVDAVLMAFPYDTPQFERMDLWSEPFYLAKPAEIPVLTPTQKGKKRLLPQAFAQLDDLKHETILLLEDGHCLRDHVISACHLSSGKQFGQGMGRTLGATSLQTLTQMVQHGYGATLLPHMAIQPNLLPPDIAVMPFAAPQPSRQIGLVWRKNDARAEEFALLGRFIKQVCAPVMPPLIS